MTTLEYFQVDERTRLERIITPILQERSYVRITGVFDAKPGHIAWDRGPPDRFAKPYFTLSLPPELADAPDSILKDAIVHVLKLIDNRYPMLTPEKERIRAWVHRNDGVAE